MGTIVEVGRRISLLELDLEIMPDGWGVECLGWNMPLGIGGEAEAPGCLTCWKEL